MAPPLAESSKHLKSAIAEQADAALAVVDSGRKDSMKRLRSKVQRMEKQVKQFKKTATDRLRSVQAQNNNKAKSEKKTSENKGKPSSKKKHSGKATRRILIPVQQVPQQRANQPQLASFIPI